MNKIAIVNITSFGREFPEHLEYLRRTFIVDKLMIDDLTNEYDLANQLKGYKYVILGNHPYFGEIFFANNSDVKLIARHGVGYNNVDIVNAKAHGVTVTHINGDVENDAVAEQALALLMALSKNIIKGNEKVHLNEWNLHREDLVGIQLFGKTCGVIGFGSIGKKFGRIMKYGFSNKILVYDPYLKDDAESWYEKCSLTELIVNSDYISLHCNLTTETNKSIGKNELEKMKSDCILINSARGALIDSGELYKTLKEKRIRAYGADVSEIEPIDKGDSLLLLNNVVLTPHSAIYNKTCMYNMNQKVMNDIEIFEKGGQPSYIIN